MLDTTAVYHCCDSSMCCLYNNSNASLSKLFIGPQILESWDYKGLPAFIL